ncbi:MAG: Na+/H+ antiporter [Cyanobacteria bacterium P01_H01_bin.74]
MSAISYASELDVQTIFTLMGVASVVGVIVRWIKIPYTVALVLVGLVLGFFNLVTPIELTEELVLFIFLPALLFEASWNLKLTHLKPSAWIILILATIGVTFSIGFIGWVLHTLLGLPILVSLLFGAMVAPTDPVSVVAIMKQLKLDHYLSALVEGESLCNDATAVVLFKLLLAVLILKGAEAAPLVLQEYALSAFLQFLVVMVGGAVVGAVVGASFLAFAKQLDDHLMELTFTTIAAYGSFLLAESISVPGQIPHLHLSGVIASVSAGLVMGNFSQKMGMTASTRVIISSFWEYAAFFMNSLIFLLIGLDIQVFDYEKHWYAVIVGVAVTLLARILMIYGASFFINVNRKINRKKLFPLSWQHVLFWGGLRGALSMALVLSLPKEIIPQEYRELIILMVFGVVFYTLVFQGTTISKLLKLLNFSNASSEAYSRHQELKTRLVGAQQALSRLSALSQGDHVFPVVKDKINQQLSDEIAELNASLDELQLSNELLVFKDEVETRAKLLKVKHTVTSEMVLEGEVNEEVGNKIKAELIESLEELEHLQFGDIKGETTK